MTTTIAIAEDNPLIAQFLSEVLSDEGYTVRVFGDGRSALAAITAHPPDLVLLDLGLPLMSGGEVLLHIRQQLGANLPIIIMTASTWRLDWAPHEATAFLTKPFDLGVLLTCIAQYAVPHTSSDKAKDVTQGTGGEGVVLTSSCATVPDSIASV